MWLLCNRVHYISDKALKFVPCGQKVQVTLFAWSYAEIEILLCGFSISTVQHCHNRMGPTAIASPRTLVSSLH